MSTTGWIKPGVIGFGEREARVAGDDRRLDFGECCQQCGGFGVVFGIVGPLRGFVNRAGDAERLELSERFRSITEMSGGKLPHLFIEAFARVFAAEFRSSGSG